MATGLARVGPAGESRPSHNVSRHPLMDVPEGGAEVAISDAPTTAHDKEVKHLVLDFRRDVPRKEGWPPRDWPSDRADRVMPGGDAVLQGAGPGLIFPLRTVN